MTNPFDNIITPEFKNIFDQAIDTILSPTGLVTPCKLVYKIEPQKTTQLCNNCIFDPISKLSSNIYNGSGPVFFENTSCPVCLGGGFTNNINDDNIMEENIDLGIISDIKRFIRLKSPVNIPDGSIQTICSTEYLTKLKNASYLIVDRSLQHYADYSYERSGDPEPCGFGSNRYITTIWKRK
jgi:hypothetical protein